MPCKGWSLTRRWSLDFVPSSCVDQHDKQYDGKLHGFNIDVTWTETAKQLVAMSSVLPAFKSFDKYFIENHLKFKLIFDSLEPQNEKLPGEWETKLNTFQKLIIIKALRPDKITLGAANFVIEHLGQPFVEPPVFNLSKSFKDSSITTPLIFILSKGTDPVASFERFAEESNMSKKCEKISLGRG